MGKRLLPLIIVFLLVVLVAGCGEKPLEDAMELTGNGFKTSYHQYMWTLLEQNNADGVAQSTYNHTDSDTFFAAVRINAETAKTQNLTSPESMETLLTTYVANYSGTKEKITSSDTDTEYVRQLSFEYQNADTNTAYTYFAKLALNKQSGEVMILLAAYPNNADGLLKDEVALMINSAVMQDMTAA